MGIRDNLDNVRVWHEKRCALCKQDISCSVEAIILQMMKEADNERKPVQCMTCEHKWMTMSTAWKINCPFCRKAMENPHAKVVVKTADSAEEVDICPI